jgi:hypothetical protein
MRMLNAEGREMTIDQQGNALTHNAWGKVRS